MIKFRKWGFRPLVYQMRGGMSYEQQARKEMAVKMNEKIDIMKETIAKTTPRSFSLLFLIASVPAFYFIN